MSRRTISSYIETNGTLEAENEVDIAARTSGPVSEIRVEEGDAVRKGQLLARVDPLEHRAQLEIARAKLNEAKRAYERAKSLDAQQLISPENYEQTLTGYETAKAQFEGSEIQYGYTSIRAPFAGVIINRYVQPAEQVGAGEPLFRISDFEPLLCPIQVPERELPKLRIGQRAYLSVESFPGERFEAEVLRIRPVIDAASGTVRVTLRVVSQGKLLPGMFARVFLETDSHEDALVMPKSALSLESIGDTVYVISGSSAVRRGVRLGFHEADLVEVLEGVSEGEQVVTVGQDALSDGTTVAVQAAPGARGAAPAAGTSTGPRAGGMRMDPSKMSPEQLERIKGFMRARGMSEEQIKKRLGRARQRSRSGDE